MRNLTNHIPRTIAPIVGHSLTKYPITAITGPRQSGKTTLLKTSFPEYTYLSLEDPDLRAFANEDPRGFLDSYPSMVILDEVQRVPDLFSYLQTHVDNQADPGQFILSGSQNFQLIAQITQSLAGRVALHTLLPLDTHELNAVGISTDDWREYLSKGFYPAIYDRSLDPAFYFSNYLRTYIERDVSQLSGVQDLKIFRSFIGLCASRAGQVVNYSDLGRDAGINHKTVKEWLSVLESSYIIYLLPSYFENFSKRIIKSPKLYFYDTGLLSYLLGIRSNQDLQNHSFIGSLFENLVISEIQKQNHHQLLLKEFWFWRDSNQHEVDLLTKEGIAFQLFEIKSTKTILPKLIKNLEFFESIVPSVVQKNLIYGGKQIQNRTNFSVLPWNKPFGTVE